MNIQKINPSVNGIAFKGHKKTMDKAGDTEHKFYYEYDSNKYNCEVEIFNIKKDKNGEITLNKKATSINMPDKSVSVDINDIDNLMSDDGFAYRFKLTDKKDPRNISYAFDNGMTIGIKDTNNTSNKYNVILNNRATITKNGPMQLIMPDFYYPGVEKDIGGSKINESLRGVALAAVRNHATKLGGNLYGIIHRLPEIEKEGVKRIVGTPFTKDTTSSHKYWTENAYRISPDLGSEKDFEKFQIELFKHGINWIADAALVNEGIEGVRISELLRKGKNSINKNLFRADEEIKLGLIPDNSKNTNLKLINFEYNVNTDGTIVKNKQYNPAMPTYIQLYDNRLVSEEQKTNNELIKEYAKKNTDNIFDITKHDDAVYPYYVEVNPKELERNMENIIKEKGRLDLSNVDIIKQLSNFSTFSITTKGASSGLEVWDGNVDIAKLNFYRNEKDDVRFLKLPIYEQKEAIKDFDRGALAVRDYAINSGKYWTQKVTDTQIEYITDIMNGFGSDVSEENINKIMSKINDLTKKGLLPKSVLDVVDKEVIENVLDNNYWLNKIDNADMKNDINPDSFNNEYTVSDYILRKSMDVPLETLPVATNLLGIITSPYIAKKANTENELGVSRYDISKANNPNLPDKYADVYNKMEDIYKNSITPLIQEITSDIHDINDDGNVSEFGKYVLSEVTPELTKFLLLKAIKPKAIKPKADIRIVDNKIDFSNVDEKTITMQSLGITYNDSTSEEEASTVVNIIENGLAQISEDEIKNLKEAITNRYKNKTEIDYKLAEMIVDRTESGLGWRIDAAKDIESIDSVRSDIASMDKTWDNVIDFWKRYNKAVLEINPHAYTTAEITDLADLSKYNKYGVETREDAALERRFLNETGITSIANYNYFFSLMPELFANASFETGDKFGSSDSGQNKEILNKMDKGWYDNPGFLFQSPDDGVKNSYNFFGNHDKPRAIHCLALDMNLFHSDLSSPEDQNRVRWCLEKFNNEPINFDKIKPQAIAMGERLNTAFHIVVQNKEEQAYIRKAIANLASGSFKGSEFDAEAFGTRPFEIAVKCVLDQVEFNGNKITNREEVEAKVLESILEPAFDRFYSMYKLLIALPGSPTDFAGDRVGASGYESKAKNYHQQNRNVINWEWLNNDNYKFVKEFYDKTNEIANLRNRPELSALNDGDTVTLPIDPDFKQNCQAFLRYNDNGSTVIVLNNLSGANTKYENRMKRDTVELQIKLNNENGNGNAKQGLKHGLEPGTEFRSTRDNDDNKYVVAENNKGEYYLKCIDEKGQEQKIVMTPEDLNTLILYKV